MGIIAVTFSTLHHVGLVVTDLERSIAFYSRLFGKEPMLHGDIHDLPSFSAQTEAVNAHAQVAFFQLDNSSVEVIQFLPSEELEQVPPHRPGSKHLSLGVDDVDSTYEAMLQEGYSFVAAPTHFGVAQGALDSVGIVCLLDPDHHIIELIEDPKQKSLLSRVGLSNPENN